MLRKTRNGSDGAIIKAHTDGGNADFAFDNVRILADNLNAATTYSYDNANVEIADR